jgi:hypothetical protein
MLPIKPRLNVAIIGAGHYARDLIYQKYIDNGNFNVVSVISPYSKILGVPIYRSLDEWLNSGKTFLMNDVVDLCVHAKYINYYVSRLSAAGVLKIILPKPIAETYNDLSSAINNYRNYHGRMFVASQWVYDYDLIKEMESASKIKFTFQQEFESKRQNIINAFLPHVAQLLYSSYSLNKKIELDFNYGKEKIRCVELDGKIIDLSWRGDLLSKMVEGFYNSFVEWSAIDLSFDKYLPVAESYLKMKEEI